MGVYELSGAGSLKTGRTLYTSMNAGNQYGAMVPIGSVTVTTGGTTSSIGFDGIPQTYQDLMLVSSAHTTFGSATATQSLYINATGATGWSQTQFGGDGSSAYSSRGTTASVTYGNIITIPGGSTNSSIFNSYVAHILNYRSSTAKTVISRNAVDLNGSGTTELYAALWNNTAAVASVAISVNGTFLAGTTATLYGIRAVSS